MEKVAIDEAPNEPNPLGVNSVRRSLADALGTEDVSLAFYELEPGEQFSGGYHTHHDQEEVFYVVDGEATFEVGPPPESDDVADQEASEDVTVGAGELIRFPPGQFQCGRNESDEQVRGLAIGAPGTRHNWEDLESIVHCSECGEKTSHGVEQPDEHGMMQVYCNECGTDLF
ncbi:cupin domain-containing protein [Halorarius halobius]|uniref:cupin domain-containing protein n=1 Tax=Halorarius halobius TaxID=2962671 RepID=UPI0020CD9D25|nr:cupin domain-containing protein [Halorarius halobius]